MATLSEQIRLLKVIQISLESLPPVIRHEITQEVIKNPAEMDSIIDSIDVEHKLTEPLQTFTGNYRVVMIKEVRNRTAAGLRWSRLACESVSWSSVAAAENWLLKSLEYQSDPFENPVTRGLL